MDRIDSISQYFRLHHFIENAQTTLYLNPLIWGKTLNQLRTILRGTHSPLSHESLLTVNCSNFLVVIKLDVTAVTHGSPPFVEKEGG